MELQWLLEDLRVTNSSNRSSTFIALLVTLSLGCTNLWGQSRDYAVELAKLDRNRNGLLEESEITEEYRRLVYKYGERAKLDIKQPMPISKIVDAIYGRLTPTTSTASAATSPTSSASKVAPLSTKATDPKSLIPGFGEKDVAAKVPGFDGTQSLMVEKTIDEIYDPRAVERTYRMLREYDRNNDGFLDEQELARTSFNNPPPNESDLNKDGKLSKHELAERYRQRYEWFGPPQPTANTALANAPRPATPTQPTAATASAGSAESAKIRSYAEGLLKQYDVNKNGLLEKDEWSQMKSEYHKADQNGDNVLTLDELIFKLSGQNSSSSSGSSGSSSSSTPPSSSSSGGSSSSRSSGSSSSSSSGSLGISKETLAAAKKAGRYLTPTERLPKGLPDWFMQNDANADGQIMMSEYAAAWSDSTVKEFEKYDLDGDGVITPEECLAVLKKMAAEKPSSSSSSSSSDSRRSR